MSVLWKWLGMPAIMVVLASAGHAETLVARAAGSAVGQPAKTLPRIRILSESDRKLYEEIFALQKRASWGEADKRISKLKRGRSRLLLGHVKAQRYLHPTDYTSKYSELAAWLKRYSDHHESRRIHKLALKRKPRGEPAPRRPTSRLYPVYEPYTTIENTGYIPVRRTPRAIIKQVRLWVGREYLSKSENYIKEKRGQLSQTDYDLARTIIASGWFFYGGQDKTANAYRLANAATQKSGSRLPYARWIAGLSAFRLRNFVEAGRHLDALRRSSEIGGWDRAAAAFWAARANMKGKRFERVDRLLRIAASEQRSFYGLIARSWLEQSSPFDWKPLTLSDSRISRIRAQPGGERVLALLQVKQFGRADHELRTMIGRGGPETAKAQIALANSYPLPASSFRAGAAWNNESDRFRVRALYPVPGWKPNGGYKVDQALIFGVMRQESAFYNRARSGMGAVGLMQLMPSTASFISGTRYVGGWSRYHKLFDPELNITLAQKYILYLLDHEAIRGNLLRMAIAYNAGPGNLQKWLAQPVRDGHHDPLMFIESIPSRETRIFVERVLAGFWIYRDQFGQEAASLTALAENNTPIYVSSEQSGKSWAQNVRD